MKHASLQRSGSGGATAAVTEETGSSRPFSMPAGYWAYYREQGARDGGSSGPAAAADEAGEHSCSGHGGTPARLVDPTEAAVSKASNAPVAQGGPQAPRDGVPAAAPATGAPAATGGATPAATPAPAPGTTPPTAAPAVTGAAPGAGSNVAASFNATRSSLAPPSGVFGQVAWNASEPVATYRAYVDGTNWRFRLDSLALDVPVGVQSLGRTDVPSSTASVVTASTWQPIVTDLTPGTARPRRSPRSSYWVQAFTLTHEIFHFDEFNTFLRASFGVFEAAIEGSGYTDAVQAGDSEAAAIRRKASDLHTRLLAAWNQAKTNMSPGMEDRAYDDGVPLYQGLVTGIRTRATSAGWTGAGGGGGGGGGTGTP